MTVRDIADMEGISVQSVYKRFKANGLKVENALALLDAGNSYTKVEAMTGISKRTLIRHRKVDV